MKQNRFIRKARWGGLILAGLCTGLMCGWMLVFPAAQRGGVSTAIPGPAGSHEYAGPVSSPVSRPSSEIQVALQSQGLGAPLAGEMSGQDESPWAFDEKSSEAHPSLCTSAPNEALNIPTSCRDLESLRQWLSMARTKEEQKRFFTHLLRDGAAGIAAALALYWTAEPTAPWRGELLAAIESESPPPMSEWLADAVARTRIAEHKEQFLDVFSRLQGPAVVESALKHLDSDLPVNGRKELLELLRHRTKAIEIGVLANALFESDAQIAAAAAEGLASIGGDRALEAVLAAAEAGNHPEALVRAITKAYSPFSQAFLIQIVTDPTMPAMMRSAAATSLSRSRSEHAMVVLKNLLQGDVPPELRDTTEKAIEQIGQEISAGPPPKNGAGTAPQDVSDEAWFVL